MDEERRGPAGSRDVARTPHAEREIARQQRWADGGLASSVVGWDRGRPLTTDDDADHGPSRWTIAGAVIGSGFTLVLVAAMIAAATGIASPPPASTPAADGVLDTETDSPELRLAIADGVVPSSAQLGVYRAALDEASESCHAPRGDIAEISRRVAETAARFDMELSNLELLEALPAASSRTPEQDCAETALDVLYSRSD